MISSCTTESIGLLSYTFLRGTGKEDIIVPMVSESIKFNHILWNYWPALELIPDFSFFLVQWSYMCRLTLSFHQMVEQEIFFYGLQKMTGSKISIWFCNGLHIKQNPSFSIKLVNHALFCFILPNFCKIHIS